MRRLSALFAIVVLNLPAARAQAPPASPLPKVILIGDSIRLGYAPRVVERLAGKAVVISRADNGGDSANVLAHLDEWVIREQPDVVHLNCGLHDLKRSKATGRHQVELDQYEANLRKIVTRIKRETKAGLVFASTTPILDDRHAKRKADFDRVEADVTRYNQAAIAVMRALDVPVHDLHWVVEQGGPATMLGADGTHYTPSAYDRLAEAVADSVLRASVIVGSRPRPAPPSGPKAAAAYRKAQAARDRQVPERFKQAGPGRFPVPRDADEWKARRPEVLKTVLTALGDMPPRPSPPRVRTITRELRPGFVLERVDLDNGIDSQVSALLLLPEGRKGPLPAVLWLHSSTPDKTQVLVPSTNGGAEPLGELFIKAGCAVLAPDAYWHGDRVGTGPAGAAETGLNEQTSLHKWHLWYGRTLWGMFVRDDQVALDYLCSRPEVDRTRIGATGISMGSTRAWWLAAVDDRIAAVVAVACFTRYQNLIAHGELRAHGVYYFVDGLLKHFDTEGVLALIAPRPLLALTGDLDAGSPADGIKELERSLGRTYQALDAGDRFRSVLYPEVGHTYTPEMRSEMKAWLDHWLLGTPHAGGGSSSGGKP